MLAPAGQTVRRFRLNPSGRFIDMDDSKDIGMAFDSPEAILEMRKRHLRVALEMQQIAAKGLSELRQRGELTIEQYVICRTRIVLRVMLSCISQPLHGHTQESTRAMGNCCKQAIAQVCAVYSPPFPRLGAFRVQWR